MIAAPFIGKAGKKSFLMEVESRVESRVECSSEFVEDQLREDLEVHELESSDGELEAIEEHSNIDMKQ